MRKNKIISVLKEVLFKVKPSKQEIKEIESHAVNFAKLLERQIKKLKINAEVFIGGSVAKKTLIKKKNYDIDIFVRFDKKYEDIEISNLTEKILRGLRLKFSIIHGSRDYFRVGVDKKSIFIEVIPVIKIKNPREARNVTDLSYSHVNYVKKQVNKNKKISDEIALAK